MQQLLPKDLLKSARKVENVEGAVRAVINNQQRPKTASHDPWGPVWPSNMDDIADERRFLEHHYRQHQQAANGLAW